jgi:hypothetical protein
MSSASGASSAAENRSYVKKCKAPAIKAKVKARESTLIRKTSAKRKDSVSAALERKLALLENLHLMTSIWQTSQR